MLEALASISQDPGMLGVAVALANELGITMVMDTEVFETLLTIIKDMLDPHNLHPQLLE